MADQGSIRCAECPPGTWPSAFESEERLKCHIAIQHVFWIPYECVICPMMLMPTETVLNQHYEFTHPGQVPKAIYTYEKTKKIEMRRILRNSREAQVDSLDEGDNRTDQPIASTDQTNHSANDNDTVDVDVEHTESNKQVGRKRKKSTSKRFSSVSVKAEEGANANDQHLGETNSKRRSMPLPNIKPAITITTSPIKIDIKNTMEETEEKHHSGGEEANEDTGITDRGNSSSAPETIANGCRLCGQVPRHRGNHIWGNHMPQKRYSCTLCQYETNWTKSIAEHARQGHDGVEHCWVDHTIPLSEDYQSAFANAFGSYVSGGAKNSDSTKKIHEVDVTKDECMLCGETVAAYRPNHIWEHHMQVPRYRCNLCEYGHNFHIALRKHVAKAHLQESADTQCWMDQSEQMSDKYRSVFEAAFGKQKAVNEEQRLRRRQSSSYGTTPSKVMRSATTPVTCPICSKQVQNQSLHMKRYHT